MPLYEASDNEAPIDQVLASQMPPLKTLVLGKILDNSNKVQTANPSHLRWAPKDLLSDRYPNYSDHATRARNARPIFSHFKGGAPIQTYLKKYGPVGPSMDSSPKMAEEMQKWLDNEFSPPAIFMMEKYNDMTTEQLFLSAKRTPDMWTLSSFWVCAVVALKSTEWKGFVTIILGMDLNPAQLPDILDAKWYSEFGYISGSLVCAVVIGCIHNSSAKYSDKELAESWHVQMMDLVPAHRLEAFESFGALSQRDSQGENPQESIVNHIIGNQGFVNEDQGFTKDQVVELRRAAFLHSHPENIFSAVSLFVFRYMGAVGYVHWVKSQFSQLTWEHQVDIRLLVLLTTTPE
ncbi:hypothetical protein FRB94_001028 [Tulasnella sp. JGI-2019a]|nr:hypothetical protein FRB94_001028 [Tulasnella sp. JGI-2019a]